MGTLHYGTSTFELDDDVLRHLMLVAATKLRRHEPFLALVRADDDSVERVWLHRSVDLHISVGCATAPLDAARLELMMREANQPAGVDLCRPWGVPARSGRR